ncbi:dethiobiotin synthase [Luteimonas sp. e5]
MIGDLYITGTDTEIGKTFSTCALLREARTQGRRVLGIKPVASGCLHTADGWRSEDALAHAQADGIDIDYATRNPYALPLPLAPELAAHAVGVELELDVMLDACRRAQALPDMDAVLVEGVGGWLAPLSESIEQADLVRALGLPVLMVVGLRLGCVHQARATQRAILADGCRFAGWIANPVDARMQAADENLAILTRVLGQAPLRTWSRV